MTNAELIAKIKAERDFTLVTKEIARYARVTPRTICNYFAKGQLHGWKLGPKLWRITIEQLIQDMPHLPDQFWIDVAIDHYAHPKTMDSVMMTIQGMK